MPELRGIGPWPKELRLRREDIYGGDGR